MKLLKPHSFGLFCCVLFGQFAYADSVTLEINGLSINADWVTAAKQPQEVILLLHGTMAHKDMEIIQSLQDSLFENDISSLAVSLSLGLDQRKGMLACEGTHRHKHEGAYTELSLWVDWLQQQGVSKIWLLGHSRGGNQVVSFGLSHSAKIAGLILIAPPSIDSQSVAVSYQRHFNKPLKTMLNQAQSQLVNGSGQNLLNIGFLHCQKATVSPQSFLSYYRDADLDTARMLQQTDLPVLVVSGSEDKVSAAIGPAVVGLNKQNIQLLEVDGADHFFRDLYVDDIVDSIVDLMETNQ